MGRLSVAHRVPRRAVAILAIGLITGCPRRTAVWVVGQAAPGRPVFAFAESRGGQATWISYIAVAPCAPPGAQTSDSYPSPLWAAVRNPTPNMPVLRRVTYGVLPTGYDLAPAAPKPGPGGVPPLGPGCYSIETEGTGWLTFQVAKDGSVLELENHSR